MYTLLDGKAQNAKTPETFHIPDAQEIAAITPGDIVKVGFQEYGAQTERMWVKVTKVADGSFEGELDNKPFGLRSITLGDPVKFGAEHILSIWE